MKPVNLFPTSHLFISKRSCTERTQTHPADAQPQPVTMTMAGLSALKETRYDDNLTGQLGTF